MPAAMTRRCRKIFFMIVSINLCITLVGVGVSVVS
jgi:hypothetical protein